MTTVERVEVAVVGAGVIGLGVAWRAARAGLSVVALDPSPGTGASTAAAGMLAPLSEASPLETELFPLASESLGRWPGFAADLTADSGVDLGLRDEGTLAVAWGEDDRRLLAEVHDRCKLFAPPGDWLSGRACRRLEPALHPGVRGGFEVPGDLQIDNRAVVAALLEALPARGGELRRQAVRRLELGSSGAGRGGATGHRLVGEDGRVVEARSVVLATGAAPLPIAGLPEACRVPVRPVRGDVLRLRGDPDEPVLSRVVRAHVDGRRVYLVPRHSGEVVVGATSEEGGFRIESRAEAVHELLHGALAVVPGLGDLELVEVLGRLRPATPDNAPVMGRTAVDGILVAGGHYRHGFLLAPVTAEAVVAELLGGRTLPAVEAFSLARFG